MLTVHQVKAGQGRFVLEAVAVQSEEGLNVYLGGGEKPHVGTVVLCLPRPSLRKDGPLSQTTSVINLVGHKDDGIGVPLAQKLCLALNVPVVVTAGVHISEARAEDIEDLLSYGEEITNKLLDRLIGTIDK